MNTERLSFYKLKINKEDKKQIHSMPQCLKRQWTFSNHGTP